MQVYTGNHCQNLFTSLPGVWGLPLPHLTHCVLLVAPDSQYHRKALKKSLHVYARPPEFLVPPAFPWRLSRGGPWHSAAGRDRAGRPQISCEITLLVRACRKTCWYFNCV